MRPPLAILLLVSLAIFPAGGLRAENDMKNLAGEWRFSLESKDVGLGQGWAGGRLPDVITLPGVVTAQGFGDAVGMDTRWTGSIRPIWKEDPSYREWQSAGNFKMPFWLQPPLYYAGAAWFQRDIDVPAEWVGRRLELLLERPHWETRVFLDGREVGRGDSLGTAHLFDLGTGVGGGAHVLTIRVDNRMIVNVGPNSHSVSDHTQGNWNGIVGRMELRATPSVWIADAQVFPSVRDATARVEIVLGGSQDGEVEVVVTHDRLDDGSFRAASRTRTAQGRASLTIDLNADARVWNEFAPHLYRLEATLRTSVGTHVRRFRFGLREVSTDGTHLLLNGRRIFLRGTLECAIFPREGHPPTDVESWRRIIRICQAHGLNHMRFHSWCPPEAAFKAADELGFYYQVEASTWPNQGATVGDGGPLDAWIKEETARMLKAYGNHPSFLLYAHGNEPAGVHHKDWLQTLVAELKQRDSRRLYTTGAGWPVMPGSDFHSTSSPRIQRWAEGLKSIINGQPPGTNYDYSGWVNQHGDAPTISHEIGQWCVYPNFKEISKYDGFFRARNLEIFRETARRNGVYDQAADFLRASGKLQTLCYKADIEAALRTPGFGGFQLLDLHDFPGQGTALVGVLDAFWEQKGYITPEEYREFAGPIVPLARLPSMIYAAGDTISGDILVSHFGAAAIPGFVEWSLKARNGTRLGEGRIGEVRRLEPGALHAIGRIEVPLASSLPAQQLRLEVTVPGTGARNHWDLFAFPRATMKPVPAGVRVTPEMDASAAAHLEAGGIVVWTPPAARMRPDPRHGPISMGFSPIFWNTVWTDWQPPHTLGILCDPTHPALARFPTEAHSNWQWWEVTKDATPFILSEHRALRPIVQVIDDWVTNRKLGLVFEARVGEGRILACSAGIDGDLSAMPARAQFRESLLAYVGSPSFQPTVQLSLEALRALVTPP